MDAFWWFWSHGRTRCRVRVFRPPDCAVAAADAWEKANEKRVNPCSPRRAVDGSGRPAPLDRSRPARQRTPATASRATRFGERLAPRTVHALAGVDLHVIEAVPKWLRAGEKPGRQDGGERVDVTSLDPNRTYRARAIAAFAPKSSRPDVDQVSMFVAGYDNASKPHAMAANNDSWPIASRCVAPRTSRRAYAIHRRSFASSGWSAHQSLGRFHEPRRQTGTGREGRWLRAFRPGYRFGGAGPPLTTPFRACSVRSRGASPPRAACARNGAMTRSAPRPYTCASTAHRSLDREAMAAVSETGQTQEGMDPSPRTRDES